MDGATTYSKSYLENTNLIREEPFKPAKNSTIFPEGAIFAGRTIYKESFLPCDIDRPVAIRPCSNIAVSDQRMSGDTTNKVNSVAKRSCLDLKFDHFYFPVELPTGVRWETWSHNSE